MPTLPHSRTGAALLILSLLAPGAAAHTAAPALPHLALDTYPPTAREAIAGAYREAQARPTDAAAAGALAALLHAWEHWDAAHEAYARTAALAPRRSTGRTSMRASCSAWRAPRMP